MYTAETSLKNHVYSSLLDDIIQGVFKTEDLLTEKSLMSRYAVSRSPIREALVALCNENVLYSVPYKGYRVTPVSESDALQVKNFRITLECGFMTANWDLLISSDLSPIGDICSRYASQDEEKDAVTLWNENNIFHLALFEYYDNEYAYQSLASAIATQTRAYAQVRWDELRCQRFVDIPGIHPLIYEAILNNQPESAVSLLKEDILSI